jgi:hypothetical protein
MRRQGKYEAGKGGGRENRGKSARGVSDVVKATGNISIQ